MLVDNMKVKRLLKLIKSTIFFTRALAVVINDRNATKNKRKEYDARNTIPEKYIVYSNCKYIDHA